MGKESCQDVFPDTTRLVRVSWLVGCILSSIGYGALLVLGYACFVTLRQQKRGNPRINKGLTAYVLLTVILVTVAEAIDIELTIAGVLDEACLFDDLRLPDPYIVRFALLFVLINLTTDGLLVSASCCPEYHAHMALGVEMLCTQ